VSLSPLYRYFPFGKAAGIFFSKCFYPSCLLFIRIYYLVLMLVLLFHSDHSLLYSQGLPSHSEGFGFGVLFLSVQNLKVVSHSLCRREQNILPDGNVLDNTDLLDRYWWMGTVC
jgi:hypothetical protein